MTNKEAYRIGFLTKLAEHGYTPSAAEELLASASIKQAWLGDAFLGLKELAGGVKGLSSAAFEALKALGMPALALGVGLPIIGGSVTG